MDLVHGNTELGLTKADIITAMVQKELAFRAKLRALITDVSQYAEKGAKTISFPKLGSFVPQKRVEGQKGTSTVIGSTLDTMPLSENAYISWIVDSKTSIQNKIKVEAELAIRAAAAHGRGVDLDIIAYCEAAAGLSVNAATPAAPTRDDILDMISFIEGNDGDLDLCSFWVSTDSRKSLLKIDEFSKNDVFGRPVIYTGQIGQLYGVPVIAHNGLGSNQILLVEKSAMAIGFQSGPAMDEQGANEYGVGAKRAAMDMLYGLMASQQGEKSVGTGKTPLIAKLRD